MNAFRIRDIFLVTILAAFSFCILFSPSAGWLGPLVFGVMVVIAVAVQRAVASPANRPFWISFLVGGFAYFWLVLICTGLLESDPMTYFIGEPWWYRRYGDVPNNNSNPEYGAYATFLLGLHVVFCASAAATAARVAQFVCRGSKPE